MPSDDRLERFDHDQRVHRRIAQGGLRGVAQAQPAHHHIERTLAPGQGQIGQRDFHGMEETRHEKTPAERDLVDFGIIQCGHTPPPQGEIADRRGLEIQFLEKRWAWILSGHGQRHPDGWPTAVQDRIAPPRWRSRRPRADRDVPP